MAQRPRERQHNDYYAREFLNNSDYTEQCAGSDGAYFSQNDANGSFPSSQSAGQPFVAQAGTVVSRPVDRSRNVYSAYASPNPPSRSGKSPSFFKQHAGLFCVIACLVGILLGVLLTACLYQAISRAPQPCASVLSQEQLDEAVGTYRIDGTVYTISAREAILGATSLESMRLDDGSYSAPTADMILSYARNQILARMVDEAGISVSSEEVAACARSIVGTDDIATVAALYNMSEDQARDIMRQAASVSKLRQSIVAGAPGAPQPPQEPTDGNTEVGNSSYASYIISLLGTNWDAAYNTWANTDNDFYRALKDAVFSHDSANYEAAQIAYSVALQSFAASQSGDDVWTNYVDRYLNEAAISIFTLRA